MRLPIVILRNCVILILLNCVIERGKPYDVDVVAG